MLRIFGLGLSAVLACLPPSYVSRFDDDLFDYMRLSCGDFRYTSDGPTWTSISTIELVLENGSETLPSGTDIEEGSNFNGMDLWRILKNRCHPNLYRYAIFISFTLSPKTLIAAEPRNDGKTDYKTYERRSECERSRKEKFGVNIDYKKSYLCRVIARSTLPF